MWGLERFFSERFRLSVLLVVFFYCALEAVYVARLPIVMDEFDGAYEAYRLRTSVPYRDFAPYKTVLGYYIEVLPSFVARNVWGRVMAVKFELVLINALLLVLAAFFMQRFVERSAIVVALLLLVVCSTFLERSAELRVDMLTGWAGLLSFLCLLDRRFALAGILCGTSFLISQKGIFYCIAANAALVLYGIFIERSRSNLAALIGFDLAATATVGAYLAFWSALSSPRTVVSATFTSAAAAALNTAYVIRGHFWWQILSRNPMYFVLAALALWRLGLALAHKRSGWVEACTAVFAAVVLAQAIAYPQPWPYFFVLLLPVLFVLHAVYFDALCRSRPDLPFGMSRPGALAVVLLGVIYPMARVPVALARDNAYQRYNVELASAILQPGDTYLAGTDIISDRQQTLLRLERLDAVALGRLRAANAHQSNDLIAAVDRHPPKLLIGNYRLYNLPPPLLAYIGMHYSRVSGSIFGYAPIAPGGRSMVRLAFSGRYRIDSPSPDRVTIDGRQFRSGEYVPLAEGLHSLTASQPVRLRLIPERFEEWLDPRFLDERDFYPSVYDY
jgi:hypothetical protein